MEKRRPASCNFRRKVRETVFFKNDVVVEDNKHRLYDGTDETEFAEIDLLL